MTAVENKTPNVDNLVKKKQKHYSVKILYIENKFIITVGYYEFTKNVVANKIKSEGLVDKSAIAGFINSADCYKKNNNISNKS